jgi:hypothetical protein
MALNGFPFNGHGGSTTSVTKRVAKEGAFCRLYTPPPQSTDDSSVTSLECFSRLAVLAFSPILGSRFASEHKSALTAL